MVFLYFKCEMRNARFRLEDFRFTYFRFQPIEPDGACLPDPNGAGGSALRRDSKARGISGADAHFSAGLFQGQRQFQRSDFGFRVLTAEVAEKARRSAKWQFIFTGGKEEKGGV